MGEERRKEIQPETEQNGAFLEGSISFAPQGNVEGVDQSEGLVVLPLNKEDGLLRLLFDSESFRDGEITNEAISQKDLKERGYSLNLYRLAEKEIIERLAEMQAQKTLEKDPESEKRKTPYIANLYNEELLQCTDEEGGVLFETLHSPQDDNYAHSSLYCRLKDKKPNYYVYARNQIKPLLKKTIIKMQNFKFLNLKE